MNGATHLRIGIAVGLATALLLETEPAETALIVAGTLLVSRLPDVDINLPIRHRAFTHSLVMVGLLVLFIQIVLPPYLGLGVGLGYISHIAADILTVGGVRLFWPLPLRVRVPFTFVRTGSIFEGLIRWGTVVLIGWMLTLMAGLHIAPILNGG